MTLVGQLASLEASGLIRLAQTQPELEYLFRHALVHEVAHESLVKSDRRMLHRAVGEAIERLYADRLDAPEIAPLLGRHFDEAGEASRAQRYYTLAGRAAARANANAEAARYFGLALEVAHAGEVVIELYLLRGRALELSSQDLAAIACYRELEEWATARGDQRGELAALAARATALLKPSLVQNTAEGHAVAERSLALARGLDDRAAEARALWNLMIYYQATWQLNEALEFGERALRLARAVNEPELLAYVLTDMQTVMFASGQLERGRAALDEARQIWRNLGVLNMLADNLSSTAIVHVLRGEYDEALALSDEAWRISTAIGNLWNQAYSGYLIDLIHFDRGEAGRAIQVAQDSVRLAEQAGFAAGLIQAEVELGLIYAYLGAYPAAFAALQSAEARTQGMHSSTETMLQTFVQASLALAHFLSGDVAAARGVFERLPPRAQASLFERAFFWVVSLVEAELAIEAGQFEHAQKIAQELTDLYGQSGIKLFSLDARLYSARALIGLGRPAEARATLEEARTQAQEIGSRRMLWEILDQLARLAVADGREAEAIALRSEAREIAAYIADHAGSAELRAAFLDRPDVRALMQDKFVSP